MLGQLIERRDLRAREQLPARIRAGLTEMAGLSLTGAQACRLFGLDERLCERLLLELVDAGFLRKLDDGSYGRGQDGADQAAGEDVSVSGGQAGAGSPGST